MPKFFTTSAGPGSGYNPSWRQRGLGLAAAFQGRDYRDPELEAYLEEQRIKRMFTERLNETEKEKDLNEARGIRHLTTAGEALSGPATPEQIARRQYAGAASEGLLTSLVGAEKAKALLPRAPQEALAGQDLNITTADTGKLVQQALGNRTRGAMPYTTAMGETEAQAELAKNAALESGSRLTTAENLALQEAGIPALSAVAKEAGLKAGAIKSEGERRYGRAALDRGLPEQQVTTEGTTAELKEMEAAQEIDNLLANREGQQKLIEATLKSKRLDAEAQAMLSELKLSAMAGGLSPKEQKELRAIVIGITRPLSQSMKLEDFGMGGSVRTPEEEEYLSTLAGLVARIQAKKAANNATIK